MLNFFKKIRISDILKMLNISSLDELPDIPGIPMIPEIEGSLTIGDIIDLISTLNKTKYENLSKLYFFLKNNILSCYKDIKKLKLKSMNYDYINYYKENNKIIDQINTIEKKEIVDYKK